MKHVRDVGVKLVALVPGQGKNVDGSNQQWLLESYSDADWSSNNSHRRSIPCAATSSTILLSLFPAQVRRQFPFHLVKVSCIPWSVVFAMACLLWHAQSLFWVRK